MNPTMPATKPELRHFPAHYLAVRWACPHDHGLLRFEDHPHTGAPIPLVAGLYTCGVHSWRYEAGEWAEVGSRVSEVA